MCGEERFAPHTTGHATGFAVCNMCGEERFAFHTTGHVTVLGIWASGGLAAFVARVGICGV